MNHSPKTQIRVKVKEEVVEPEVEMSNQTKVLLLLSPLTDDSVDETYENDYMLDMRSDMKNTSTKVPLNNDVYKKRKRDVEGSKKVKK